MQKEDVGPFLDKLHEEEGAFYVSLREVGGTFIAKYDLDLKEIYHKPLAWEINEEKHQKEGIHFLGDRIMVFSSHFNKAEEVNVLYLRVFDKKDMSPMGAMERVLSFPAQKAWNAGSFKVSTSPGEEFVLVSLTRPRERGANEELELRVYDEQAALTWARKVTLPYADDEFTVESLIIDDAGSVMILGVKYDEKKERKLKFKKGEVYYRYHILVCKDGSAPVEDTPVDVPDKFLQDMTISTVTDGDIVCGGFWGNKSTWSTRGAFYLRMDRTTIQIEHESFKEFTDDFITSYMSEKEEKRAEKRAEKKQDEITIFRVRLDEIVFHDDGGATLLGEQAFSYVACAPSANGGTNCGTAHINNDIIVVNISPEGNIEWCSKIPKRQHGSGDLNFGSYALARKGSKIYLVFNDSGKNFALLPDEKAHLFMSAAKDAVVTLATIEEDGQTHREVLFTPKNRESMLHPSSCAQLADGRMLIYSQGFKTFRFGMISFH